MLRKVMKMHWSRHLLAIGIGLSSALVAQAGQGSCGDAVDAQGKVFYVVPEGDLVTREVTLTVPACGQGNVALSSSSGWRVESNTFFTKKENGQTRFIVIFQNPKGDNPNKFLTLRGSYLRGKNLAKYWGDLYTVTFPEGTPNQLQEVERLTHLHHYGTHAGGFAFKAEVPASEPTPAPSAIFE